jgi:hypothetical protein
MRTDEIIINDYDSPEEVAIKTVLLNLGNPDLKRKLDKLKVTYSIVKKELHTVYVLRGKTIGKIEIQI